MSSSSTQPLIRPRSSLSVLRAPPRPLEGPAPRLWPWWLWLAVFAAVIGASIVFVTAVGMRPSWDPYGWLVWGHQTLRWNLDLNAAPSWKPLTIIFTLPYALFRGFAVPLWSVTATAGTIAMGVFAWRIAYRLCLEDRFSSTRWGILAAWAGALFAGVGVLGMEGLSQLTFIANSDQLNTALVLAAIDAHLCRRPRLAYVVLFFAALGRPEVWPFLFLYGLWVAWRIPGTRLLVFGGWVLLLAAWYVPTGVASHSLFSASNLDMNKPKAIHGNKVVGVFKRWANLYEWPVQAAAVIGVAIAVARRDKRVLWLTAAALLWVVVELAFALHGLSAVPRYMMESGAVMITIGGVAVAQLIAGLPGVLGGRSPVPRWRIAVGSLVVIGLLVAMVPFAHRRAYEWKVGVPHARSAGVVIDRLSDVVKQAGGPKAILACGPVAALNQHQSQLAWAMGLNVSDVYYNPPLLKRMRMRMVLFTQRGQGWVVKPYNVPASAHCPASVTTSN